MSKENNKGNTNLSTALRNNLKLRKKQLFLRDKEKIQGKRTTKIGISNLIKHNSSE